MKHLSLFHFPTFVGKVVLLGLIAVPDGHRRTAT